MEQRMIDREKLDKYLILRAEECKSRARKHAERECFAYASNAERQADFYIRFKDEINNADIYADEPKEPKWHWEDITADNLPKYYGQEVEVWDNGNENDKTIAILIGYRFGSSCPILTNCVYGVCCWEHARVKVYEEV